MCYLFPYVPPPQPEFTVLYVVLKATGYRIETEESEFESVLSLEVKRPELEVDHSPPTNVEVNKSWIYICTPPYVFMA
jgi:hypothetical protein